MNIYSATEHDSQHFLNTSSSLSSNIEGGEASSTARSSAKLWNEHEALSCRITQRRWLISNVYLRNFRRAIVRNFSRYQSWLLRSVSRGGAPFALSSATSTIRFSSLCALWYATSALSSNTGKTILIHFCYPITLTIIQFGFVALYCLLLMTPAIKISRLRPPTRIIMSNTALMGLFQVGGHMFSSMAMSRIPVSTVHTIKVR